MSYKAKLIIANAEHSLTVILSQHFDGISFRYVSIMFYFVCSDFGFLVIMSAISHLLYKLVFYRNKYANIISQSHFFSKECGKYVEKYIPLS